MIKKNCKKTVNSKFLFNRFRIISSADGSSGESDDIEIRSDSFEPTLQDSQDWELYNEFLSCLENRLSNRAGSDSNSNLH